MADKKITYGNWPSLEQWKKDSSVTLATRNDDVLLRRIDMLMEAAWKCPDDAATLFVGTDLFFTLDYWLKTYPNHAKMKKERQPAVQGLYEWVVHYLCLAWGVTVNVLPRELEAVFEIGRAHV